MKADVRLQAEAVPDIRPLAKEELSDLIPIAKDILHRFLIAAFGEGDKGAPDKEHFDPAKWARVREWIKVYMDLCSRVAEYESPKFKPIEVTPAQAAVDEAERRGENEVTVGNSPRGRQGSGTQHNRLADRGAEPGAELGPALRR